MPTIEQENKRIASNAAWSASAVILPAIIHFVSLPIYLHYISIKDYGIYALAFTAFAMSGILKLGLPSAVTKFVAYFSNNNRDDLVSCTVFITFCFFVLVSLVSVSIFYFFNGVLSSFLTSSSTDKEHLALSFKIASAGLPAMIFSSAITAFFDGIERFSISRLLLILYSILLFFSSVVFLKLGFDLYSLVYALVISHWISFVVGLLFIAIIMPKHKFSIKDTIQTSKKIFRFGLYTTLTDISSTIFGQTDRLVIGRQLGMEAVGLYSVLCGLTSKLYVLGTTLGRAAFPRFSSIPISPETREHRLKVFQQLWSVSISFASFGLVGLLGLTELVFSLWLNIPYDFAGFSLYLLLSFSFSLHCIWVIPYFYLLGSNSEKFATLVFAVGGLLQLLALIYIGKFGLVYVGFSLLVFPLVSTMMAYHAICKLKGSLDWALIRSGLIVFVSALVTGGAAVLATLYLSKSLLLVSLYISIALAFHMGFFFLSYKVGGLVPKYGAEFILSILKKRPKSPQINKTV